MRIVNNTPIIIVNNNKRARVHSTSPELNMAKTLKKELTLHTQPPVILAWNISGYNNLPDFSSNNHDNFEILCLCETWLTCEAKIPNNCFQDFKILSINGIKGLLGEPAVV